MDNRLELHNKLCDLLGSKNCYFQPPSDIIPLRADDMIYLSYYMFSVTWITKIANIDIPIKVMRTFPQTKLDQIFASENLMHYVFTITIPVKE